MREILFRGKEKRTGKWREGSLLKYPNAATIKRIYGDRVFHTATYEVIPETVGQYTGLTDKNGTRIFEGDIVIDHAEYMPIMQIVEYNNDKACYSINGLSVTSDDCKERFEVIGNIYDNPELMEVT